MTKSAGNCGLGQFTEEILKEKLHISCSENTEILPNFLVWKFYGNYTFPKNFNTKKLGAIPVFYGVCLVQSLLCLIFQKIYFFAKTVGYKNKRKGKFVRIKGSFKRNYLRFAKNRILVFSLILPEWILKIGWMCVCLHVYMFRCI